MTQILTTARDKEECFDLLRYILKRHIFAGVTPPQETQVIQHLEWMRSQPGDLNVNCKLETVPELQMTRVVLEYSHKQIPPVGAPAH